jgi:hypothetical protein
MTAADKRRLVDILRSHGYVVTLSSNGQYLVQTADGQQVTVFTAADSSDWRERNNVRTQLRSAGFEWNPRRPEKTGPCAPRQADVGRGAPVVRSGRNRRAVPAR